MRVHVMKLFKSILTLLLFFIGILWVRHICSYPARVDFSIYSIIWLIIGFVFILTAALMASELLYITVKIPRGKLFAVIFSIVLIFLSFGSTHSSLYPFFTRVGQNGIVSDTEIVTKEEIIGGITPKKAIEIADNYLRNPDEADNTYYFDMIENKSNEAPGKYIWIMYIDYWMKSVVVSTVPWESIMYDGNIRWEPPNPIDAPYINEDLYEVAFYFNSVLHKEDNKLIVYIDKEGNDVGTSTWILE